MESELARNVSEVFELCDMVSDLNTKLASKIVEADKALTQINALEGESAAQNRAICHKLQPVTAQAQSYNVMVGNLSTIANQERRATINQLQPPALQPLTDYTRELEQAIGEVQHSNSELSAACTTAIELTNEAARTNRRTGRVVGGAVTAAIVAGVGTSNILSDIASVSPFGVGTLIGLRAMAAGAAAAGIGSGRASAAVAAHIARDFEETETAFRKLKKIVAEMQQAVQSLHHKVEAILNLVKNSMDNQGSPEYPMNRSNESLGKLDRPPNLDQESQGED